MGKKRLRDALEFTEKETENLRRNQLLIFPILSIIIGVVTIAPLLIFISRAQNASIFIYVPIIFGVFMLFTGIKKLIIDRKEIALYLSKKKKTEDS